jgi:hypothetical protein
MEGIRNPSLQRLYVPTRNIVTCTPHRGRKQGPGSEERPNATGASPETFGNVGQRINNWINKDAFSPAPALTFGNLSRTISERGPGLFNWDISIFKNFPVYERFKAQFRAEALNAFNTPYFRSPNTSFGSSSLGQILSQGNFPRFIELGLRLQF